MCGAAPSPAADAKENPEYVYWAKFKPGTTAVTVSELDGGRVKYTTENTTTLVEVKPDMLVLETATTTTVNGQTKAAPARKRDVPAKKGDVIEMKDTGEEELEVAGKKLKCKVKEYTSKIGLKGAEIETKGKAYFNESVPGGVVKMVTSNTRGTTTLTLKSFDVK